MHIFSIKHNQLRVEFEMFNDTVVFSQYCCKLIASEHKDIEVWFSDRVLSICSQHIGVLLMASAMAKECGKKLTIHCVDRLARSFHILGGKQLELKVRESTL